MANRIKKHTIYKRTLSTLLALVTVVSFTGCSFPLDSLAFPWNEEKEEIKVIQDDNISPDFIVVEKVEELEEDENAPEALPEKNFSEASEELVASDGLKLYAYDHLNDDEKRLYVEIYSIIDTMAMDTKVSSLDMDEIEKVFNYVMYDHPELFYIKGYSCTKYMRGSNIEKIVISGNYTMDAKAVEAAKVDVEEYVEKCISGYNGPVDDYEKIKYVYKYLIMNTEYDLAAPNNQNVLSVVQEGRTVCQGYAKSMQLILNRMGVFCILCEGLVKGTESHVWNIVRVGDKYYHTDATWGDASYQIEETDIDVEAPEINYDFLNIPDTEIKETHVIKDNIEYPQCNSMDDNYYVREGLYLTEIDTNVIMAAFDNARANGENMVTLKCANANVYTALYNHMIDNKKIFDYLNGSTTVNYVQFRDACRMSFYI